MGARTSREAGASGGGPVAPGSNSKVGVEFDEASDYLGPHGFTTSVCRKQGKGGGANLFAYFWPAPPEAGPVRAVVILTHGNDSYICFDYLRFQASAWDAGAHEAQRIRRHMWHRMQHGNAQRMRAWLDATHAHMLICTRMPARASIHAYCCGRPPAFGRNPMCGPLPSIPYEPIHWPIGWPEHTSVPRLQAIGPPTPPLRWPPSPLPLARPLRSPLGFCL